MAYEFVPSPLLVESSDSGQSVEALARKSLSLADTVNSHPDWIRLDGNEIGMEGLRSALYELKHRPFEADKRVFSIINFQDCNRHIQNALLKTLEEPKDYWVILLGVGSSFGLLSTIRSRCLVYRESEVKDFEISEETEDIFLYTKNKNDLALFPRLEKLLKNRDQSKALFKNLLRKASKESYPGFWSAFALELEQSLHLVDRNISPKIIWEMAWTKADENH